MLASGESILTPIIPILIGDDWRSRASVAGRSTTEVCSRAALLHQTLPPGPALLRTSVMATHDRDTLDRALDAFGQVKREFEAEHGPLGEPEVT